MWPNAYLLSLLLYHVLLYHVSRLHKICETNQNLM